MKRSFHSASTALAMTLVLGTFAVLGLGCGTIDANGFLGLETCDILNCDGLFFGHLADDHDDMPGMNGMDDGDAHDDEDDDHMDGVDDHDVESDDEHMDDLDEDGHDAEEEEDAEATESEDGSGHAFSAIPAERMHGV